MRYMEFGIVTALTVRREQTMIGTKNFCYKEKTSQQLESASL